MKKFFCLSLLLLTTITLSAQTQQGYVKTKGRLVGGKHVKGQGLPGASVKIQKGNTVVVRNTDGSFSFVIPSQTFVIQSIKKNGYQLVDADQTSKPFWHSVNPIIIVMETPEQQLQDKLDAERKLRRTLQQQLQKREEEIDEMNVSIVEKQQLIEELYQNQQNNDKLISDMAMEYAQMDYDQMDELNQRISDAIINGRLTEADSLLRSKGDISTRAAEVKRARQIEEKEESELAERREKLAASKAGTQKKLEDIAADCYKRFNICKLENKYDSAAYYITLRSDLDDDNADWQHDAALYFHKQNSYQEALTYYTRTLRLYRQMSADHPHTYEPFVARTLNNIAIVLTKIGQMEDAEKAYLSALDISTQLANDNPQDYESDVATTLNNLAIWYFNENNLEKSEQMYIEAVKIRRNQVDREQQGIRLELAATLNNLGNLYLSAGKLDESISCYEEALSSLKSQYAANEETYLPDIAAIMNNLATLYYRTGQLNVCEQMYDEVIESYCELIKKNPLAYEPYLSEVVLNVKKVFSAKEEQSLLAKTHLFKHLAENLPVYRREHASALNSLAVYYDNVKKHSESEDAYKDALDIYRQLYSEKPEIYKALVARGLSNLSYHYLLTQDNEKAEQFANAGLEADGSAHYIYTNLAMSLLLQGKSQEANDIYIRYRTLLKNDFLEDMNHFESLGLIPEDRKNEIEQLKRLLTN